AVDGAHVRRRWLRARARDPPARAGTAATRLRRKRASDGIVDAGGLPGGVTQLTTTVVAAGGSTPRSDHGGSRRYSRHESSNAAHEPSTNRQSFLHSPCFSLAARPTSDNPSPKLRPRRCPPAPR